MWSEKIRAWTYSSHWLCSDVERSFANENHKQMHRFPSVLESNSSRERSERKRNFSRWFLSTQKIHRRNLTGRYWLLFTLDWWFVDNFVISYWRKRMTNWTWFSDEISARNVPRRFESERCKFCSLDVWTFEDLKVLEKRRKKMCPNNLRPMCWLTFDWSVWWWSDEICVVIVNRPRIVREIDRRFVHKPVQLLSIDSCRDVPIDFDSIDNQSKQEKDKTIHRFVI